MDFLNLNTVPPGPPPEEVPTEGTENTEATLPEADQAQTGEAPQEQAETPQPETKVDEFIDNLNKRFGTQFKADDEVKQVFGLQKTVDGYKAQLQEKEGLAKSIEDYKKRIEELEGSQDPLKYFSSPDTYIAEQLRIKYPKSNPVLLQEIATSNVDEMDDFEVLVKEKQLFVPKIAKEGNVRAVILKKYGLDMEADPKDWDEISKTEMAFDAAAARERINELKRNIEMPKVITKEQRQVMESEARLKKEQAIAPIKETFSKFDKFSYEGFEFDVPSEYQSKLPDMFQSMFVDAGLDPTEENLQTALELREALFLKQYFPKIKEVIAKEAETRLQAKLDAELNNTQPPNTATNAQENVNTLPGLSDFLSGQRLR